MKNTPYSCILNSLLYTPLPQAPSLLITLIQMFLEFSKAPNDYVTRKPDDDPDLLNEYSVFGSDQTHGAIQVHYTIRTVPVPHRCKPWVCLLHGAGEVFD